ncbi:MAG: hypothetical protein KDJ38_02315 [Gammaproteobacteria bacterium]|nr:hypothetical protein [Gammaproteobacteria bacterium]
MGGERDLYKDKQYTVTSRHFKTPNKGYRVSAITHVRLGRAHFYVLLPVLLGTLGMVGFCYELLYAYEILFSIVATAVISGLAWSVVTLELRGLNVDGIAAIGLYWKMEPIELALNRALETSERRQSHYKNSTHYS